MKYSLSADCGTCPFIQKVSDNSIKSLLAITTPKKILDDAGLKDGLKVLWFASGSEDFLMRSTKNTIEALKKHEFKPVFKETSGGHTWINWRNYLNEFAPMLFQ